MRDMKKLIEQRVADQLVESELDLTPREIVSHTAYFMTEVFDQRKLGTAHGYTPEDALRNQVLQYLKDDMGVDDPREGE